MSRQRKSYARRVANTEYVEANGINPTSARPAAVPSSDCSDMPIWKNRSGCLSRKMCMSVYFARSADNPTISGRCSASWSSAWPNGAGVVGCPGSAKEAIIAEVVRRFFFGAVGVVVVIAGAPGGGWRGERGASSGEGLVELGPRNVPLVLLDAHEVRFLAVHQQRDAAADAGVTDDHRR